MLNLEHPEYLKLKKRMMTGWRTYNVYSVLSHVRMEDGLALNVAVKEYSAGHYLKEALIGRRPVGAHMHERETEEVLPGLHAYDGSYTQATVQWMGMEFSVESTQDGSELILLITPQKQQRWPSMLVLETGFLWNRPGWVEHTEDGLCAHSPMGDTPIYTTGKPAAHDANIPAQGPYFACEFTEPIAFSTHRPVTVSQARELLDGRRQALLDSFARYGESAPLYEAIQCAVAWDTTYDGRRDRIASPISRLWSIGAGGFIMACWDNYFVSFMASLEDRDLAYANIIEITREQTDRGFIPISPTLRAIPARTAPSRRWAPPCCWSCTAGTGINGCWSTCTPRLRSGTTGSIPTVETKIMAASAGAATPMRAGAATTGSWPGSTTPMAGPWRRAWTTPPCTTASPSTRRST